MKAGNATRNLSDGNTNLIASIRKLLTLLDRHDRFLTLWILAICMAASLLEIVGIGLIFPFLKVVSDPQSIISNKWLKILYDASTLNSLKQFIVLAGILFSGYIAVKNGLLLLLSYLQSSIFKGIQLRTAQRLMRAYVTGPYLLHTQVNSSDIQKILSKEMEYVFGLVLHPGITVFAESLVVFGIVLVLAAAAPANTLIAAVFFVAVAFFLYSMTKKRAQRLGIEGQEHLRQYMRWINQSINGIEEVKLTGSEDYFVKQYSQNVDKYLSAQVVRSILNNLPRLTIETVFIAGVIAIILASLVKGGNTSNVISLVGLFAAASMRLMPAFNRILVATTHAKYHAVSVDIVYNDFHRFGEPPQGAMSLDRADIIHFENTIELKNVSFRYPTRDENVLTDISLEIKKGETIGFAGGSGSGKTTLARIILGLIAPNGGKVLVDEIAVNQQTIGWKQLIGYVPQNVYLCDDTLRSNIAFGIPLDEIDNSRLADAIHKARLQEFVRNLPDKLETIVGERGVALSGGQRQRIGIARALYRNPEILVLDEATSSLDKQTENEIEKTIADLSQSVTCLIIAHRISTIRSCERIFYLKNGRIRGMGTFDDLFETDSSFRAMVGEAAEKSSIN